MNKIENLTVYLGSSNKCRDIFKESAKKLGYLIGEHKKTLIYGGMDAGLMRIIANNAIESGANVTGIIPQNLQDSDRIHNNLNETILVSDLWERKLGMFNRADAIITLAGGYGTIDELLEVLYWAKLGLHNKPIIIVNTDNYWGFAIDYINGLEDFPKEILIVVDKVEDIFDEIKNWKLAPIDKENENFPNFEADILSTKSEPIIIETVSIENTYHLATALCLKQLNHHQRVIGLLNDQKQFDSLLEWINHAQQEHFITDKCTQLFSVGTTHKELTERLSQQKKIYIDLHNEKWGK